MYPYMQTYKNTSGINDIKLICTKLLCRSAMDIRAQQISLFHVFVYYLVDSHLIVPGALTVHTLKVLNKNRK